MGLPARRGASGRPGAAGPRRGVRVLPPQLLLLVLLRPGAGGAAARGEARGDTVYLWKTGKCDGVRPPSHLHIWVHTAKLRGRRRDPCTS